jgi:hypothetical protein
VLQIANAVRDGYWLRGDCGAVTGVFESTRMSSRRRADSPYAYSVAPPCPRAERRQSVRGVSGEPSRSHLVRLVLGTYAEMPGLTLHVQQAARLFGLRELTCLVVLDDLVRDGRLRQSPDGQYRALNGGDL